jgi:hypothetical protein
VHVRYQQKRRQLNATHTCVQVVALAYGQQGLHVGERLQVCGRLAMVWLSGGLSPMSCHRYLMGRKCLPCCSSSITVAGTAFFATCLYSTKASLLLRP